MRMWEPPHVFKQPHGPRTNLSPRAVGHKRLPAHRSFDGHLKRSFGLDETSWRKEKLRSRDTSPLNATSACPSLRPHGALRLSPRRRAAQGRRLAPEPRYLCRSTSPPLWSSRLPGHSVCYFQLKGTKKHRDTIRANLVQKPSYAENGFLRPGTQPRNTVFTVPLSGMELGHQSDFGQFGSSTENAFPSGGISGIRNVCDSGRRHLKTTGHGTSFVVYGKESVNRHHFEKGQSFGHLQDSCQATFSPLRQQGFRQLLNFRLQTLHALGDQGQDGVTRHPERYRPSLNALGIEAKKKKSE